MDASSEHVSIIIVIERLLLLELLLVLRAFLQLIVFCIYLGGRRSSMENLIDYMIVRIFKKKKRIKKL